MVDYKKALDNVKMKDVLQMIEETEVLMGITYRIKHIYTRNESLINVNGQLLELVGTALR